MLLESCWGKGMKGAWPCGCPPRTTAPPVIVVVPCGGVMLFADGSGIDGAVRSHGDGGDFALGGFVEDETFGSGGVFIFAGFIFGARDAQDAAARFGSGEKIIASVEGEDADVRFVAGVEQLTLAVRGNGEDLAFVAGSDEERAIRGEGEIPNVFSLGIEKYRFFAGG